MCKCNVNKVFVRLYTLPFACNLYEYYVYLCVCRVCVCESVEIDRKKKNSEINGRM